MYGNEKCAVFCCCCCCLSNLMEEAALMCILRVTAPVIVQYHMLREGIGFHILFFWQIHWILALVYEA